MSMTGKSLLRVARVVYETGNCDSDDTVAYTYVANNRLARKTGSTPVFDVCAQTDERKR